MMQASVFLDSARCSIMQLGGICIMQHDAGEMQHDGGEMQHDAGEMLHDAASCCMMLHDATKYRPPQV
eukprot:gene4146-5063_t